MNKHLVGILNVIDILLDVSLKCVLLCFSAKYTILGNQNTHDTEKNTKWTR